MEILKLKLVVHIETTGVKVVQLNGEGTRLWLSNACTRNFDSEPLASTHYITVLWTFAIYACFIDTDLLTINLEQNIAVVTSAARYLYLFNHLFMFEHITQSAEKSTSWRLSESVVVMLYTFWTEMSRPLRRPVRGTISVPTEEEAGCAPQTVRKSCTRIWAKLNPRSCSPYLLSFLGVWAGIAQWV